MKCRKGIPVILALMCCAHMGAGLDTGWVHCEGNPQRTAYTPESGPDVPEVLWTVKISCYGTNMWTGETTYGPGTFDTPPFIVGDEVLALWKDSAYHTASRTKVILVNLLTGEIFQKETVCVEGGYYFLNVFPVNNRIIGRSYLGFEEYNPNTGRVETLVETHEKDGGPNAYPLLLEDKCIIHTTPPVCFSLSDFSVIWSLEGMTDSDWSLEGMTDSDWSSSYAVGDEDLVIFVMSKALGSNYSPQRILAVDPSTGVLKWENDSIEAVQWLTLRSDAVYCGGKKLWAFNRDGSEKWEFVPENTIHSNLVLGPDAVYCADAGNNLYKVDLDGNLIWKTHYEGYSILQTHLLGADDILYCIGNFIDDVHAHDQSQIAAYSMKDGSIIWEVGRGTLGGVSGSPAISQGILVVGTLDGELVAFASDPELFVRQGEAFISVGLKEKALNSYQKAITLYEKKGNSKKAEEIKKRITELGISPTPTVPPSSSASTEPTPSPPPSTSRPLKPVQESGILIASTGAVILILIMIYAKRKRKS